jgi:hypothetical protein
MSRPWWHPDVLDRLPLLGVGTAGQVRRSGDRVVKIAHPTAASRARLLEEVTQLRALARTIAVPKVHAVRPDGSAFLRDFVHGSRVSDLLERGPLDEALLDALWLMRGQVGPEVDFTPPNLYWDGHTLVLADGGRRTEPNRLLAPGRTRRDLPALLAAWKAWSQRRAHAPRLDPMIFPPSGRFAVPVPVGPAPRARVLWLNEGFLARHQLTQWSAATVERVAAVSTISKTPTTELLASRYQDSAELTEDGAKGDGRTVYLGTTSGGRYGTLELQLKGVGPTPLAWKGHAYHEDGYVSFPRTLWETSIADELARLGFETPESMAVLSNGARTVDNTDRSWPAATSVRVASTCFRLGHLRRWSHRRADHPALRAILEHVGRKVAGPRFDPERARDLSALSLGFAQNLGHDVGRSDALNIHCFHPTLGNVRVDGHFIDFSTVRIFRGYLPDFRFLNGLRKVGGHRQIWRGQLGVWVATLRDGGLLDESGSLRLTQRMRRAYERAYLAGYWAGTARWLGTTRDAASIEPRALERFVEATLALKRVRARDVVRFRFFAQAVPAPLFDLEGRAPELLLSWQRGAPEAWRRLARPERMDDLDEDAHRLGRSWLKRLGDVIPPDERAQLTPRRFAEVIRPCMEAEALSRLCYRRSRPRSFEAWKLAISTSRHLPEGVYDYFEARRRARALGHLSFPGLLPLRYEVVVGLTPELYGALVAELRATLGDELASVWAHGSRVMTRERLRAIDPRAFIDGTLREKAPGLREWGPDPRKSSDLDLKVFLRTRLRAAERDRLELELGARLAALGARFPLCAHQPPRVRLWTARHPDAAAAFRAYVARDRPKLGRGPIPERQVVALWSPELVLDDVEARVLSTLDDPASDEAPQRAVDELRLGRGIDRADTRSPVEVDMLEVILRDHPTLEPPAVLVDRRGVVRAGAGVVLAARAAGRDSVRVRSHSAE